VRRIYLIALVLALACVLPAGALGQCPILTKNLDKDQPVPVINVPVDSDTFIHGKIPQVAGAVPNGKVQVCVDANAAGGPVWMAVLLPIQGALSMPARRSPLNLSAPRQVTPLASQLT